MVLLNMLHRKDYNFILKQITLLCNEKDLLLIDEELKVVSLDFEIINKCFEEVMNAPIH